MSTKEALQYISIYVYMKGMCGKERVGEGEKGKGDKLKGRPGPSNKFPIGEYISNRSNRQSFLREFSTGFFYVDFLRQFSTSEPVLTKCYKR